MPAHMSFRDKLSALMTTAQLNVKSKTDSLSNKSDDAAMALQRFKDRHGGINYSDVKDIMFGKTQKNRERFFYSYREARKFLDEFDPKSPHGNKTKVQEADWNNNLRPGGITDNDLRKLFATDQEVCFVMRNSDNLALKRIEWQNSISQKSAPSHLKAAITKHALHEGKSKKEAQKEGRSTTVDVLNWHILWSAAG